MRRVLLVGALPPPTGGVATHVRDLVRALRQHEIAVSAIDPRRRGPDGRDGRVRLIAALARARLTGALVHLHTNGHNRGSWALALACGGPRAILTLHSGLAPAFIAAHRRIARVAAGRFARVIAVSDPIAAALAGAGLPPERLLVCPAFSPASLSLRLAPPGLAQLRRAHQPLLACALAPGIEYGAAVLFDAFARIRARAPSAGLIVYGPGTRALGRRPGVACYGELTRERALAVVAAADLFIRPTLADGDAISVREALALGRPVAASAVGCRPPAAHTFPAGDSAALAELVFHITGRGGAIASAPVDDCLPAILAAYRRCGLSLPAVPLGTPLAI
jgi:glycosyltransferase involved in cell wall biosynthesis